MRSALAPDHASQGLVVDLWPFRIIAGRCELLLLHRVEDVDGGGARGVFWQGVSGGIEPGEGAAAAALRELREETGLEPMRFYTLDAIFQLYNVARDRIETVVVFAAEVAASTDPSLSDEHDEWQWVSVERAVEVLPFAPQRIAVERLLADIIERPQEAFRYLIEEDVT